MSIPIIASKQSAPIPAAETSRLAETINHSTNRKGEKSTMGRNTVTRTIVSTVVSVLALDTNTAEPENKTYEVAGTFKSADKLLKAVQKLHDTDTFKNAKVVDYHEKETLYGMSEDEFITHAQPLDPKTRKPIAADDATETDAE